MIDARGIAENSRRHGYLAAMLGITRIVVLINKIDLIGYDGVSLQRSNRTTPFSRVGIVPVGFILFRPRG